MCSEALIHGVASIIAKSEHEKVEAYQRLLSPGKQIIPEESFKFMIHLLQGGKHLGS